MPEPPRPTKEAVRRESLGSDDTPIFRKAQTLNKPNLGEGLELATLAEEFGVNIRTIQCDLNECLANLPLNKIDCHYRLDRAILGKIDLRDVERFAGLVGIYELFLSLSTDVLRDTIDDRTQSRLLINRQRYEDLSGCKVPSEHWKRPESRTFISTSSARKACRTNWKTKFVPPLARYPLI
ncbi:hypothetical protein Q1Z72_07095 [Pseudomonas qingdaonensis]|uniref:hypothetical protein n=1 Tax=Pseudomonas qingdaonensis TaxID=2056231 RepID=UPI00265F3A15|nr:hypothetical protein [Pseudomonas qingdaonensis]WKL68424.1 hypothetical protein Q1Z72_07095 [Pseudomonas qingdaonensis]